MASSKARLPNPRTATRSIHILGLLVVGTLVGACGDGGTVCTAELRTSVLATVVDQFNAPLAGATATYQVDGGPTQVISCDQFWIGTCLVGYEVSGAFTIAVSRPGYTTSSASVTVDRDECHVITEYVTLVLQPVP
jgi:hypothetical protein